MHFINFLLLLYFAFLERNQIHQHHQSYCRKKPFVSPGAGSGAARCQGSAPLVSLRSVFANIGASTAPVLRVPQAEGTSGGLAPPGLVSTAALRVSEVYKARVSAFLRYTQTLAHAETRALQLPPELCLPKSPVKCPGQPQRSHSDRNVVQISSGSSTGCWPPLSCCCNLPPALNLIMVQGLD